MNSISVIGLGYIGLPTAALLANKGFRVFGVDVNEVAVSLINNGQIHIVEPELDSYVQSAVSNGALSAHLTPQVADVYMICVPTPFVDGGNDIPQPDLSYVMSAVEGISGLIKQNDIIILESTSPVGTTEEVANLLSSRGVDTSQISIAYCPERVLPGQVMRELVENNRIVGGMTEICSTRVKEFYSTFVEGSVVFTNSRTAEMCKLAENSFRDVNIAFANELSVISDQNCVDVWELINLTNLHPRVNILQPGTGVGGHCIAVDPWFLAASSPSHSQLIQAARNVNLSKPKWVINKISEAASKLEKIDKHATKVACLGLAFKPDIDDCRESPALEVALSLKELGFEVTAVEPNVEALELLDLVSLEEAIEQADVIAVLVKHKEFISSRNVDRLNQSELIVLDFCGALS